MQLLEDHLQRWGNYQELPDGGEEAYRARALVMVEIINLSYEDIAKFYQGPEDAEPEVNA